MKQGEYNFDLSNLDSELASFSKKGITEFALHDERFSSDKKALAEFMRKAARLAPEVYYSIPIKAEILDAEIVGLLQELFCSVDVIMRGELGQKYFLFKKSRALEQLRACLWLFDGLGARGRRFGKRLPRPRGLRASALSKPH